MILAHTNVLGIDVNAEQSLNISNELVMSLPVILPLMVVMFLQVSNIHAQYGGNSYLN